MRKIGSGVLAALFAAAMMAPGVLAADTKTIEQKLEDLQRQIQELQHQLQVDRESAQIAAKEEKEQQTRLKDMPLVKAGAEGFSLSSPEGNFKLRLGGYVQADGRVYLEDHTNKLTDSLLLRRVRPIIEGTLYRDFDFRVMADLASGQSLIQDAYLEWHTWPWLKLRAGKFKPPTGLERLQSDTWLFFAERGLPTDLLPDRDVGAQLSGDLFGGVVTYAGGIFNGSPDSASADFDTFDSKDGAARIFVVPFKKTDLTPLKGFGFGVAGTIGNQQFTSTTTNLASYKSTGQNTFFSFSKGVAPDGLELRGTPQAYYYWGPLGLMGEYVYTDQELRNGATVDHLRNSAWQVQGSFVLTGEKAGYSGVVPKRPFDVKNGGWGAFELVARYGQLHLDPTAFSTFADPTKSAQEAREWGIGLNWYLNRNLKFLINYEETAFDAGGGSVGALKSRPTERAIITRGQVVF